MLFFRLLSRLPLSLLYLVANGLYWLAFYAFKYRRQVVYRNMSRSFPEKNEAEIHRLAKAFYRNLADIMVESIKAITISREEIRQRVRFTNPETAQHYHTHSHPFLLMTAHQCNWEWVLLSGSLLQVPVDAVYKPLHNPFFDQLMLTIRTRFDAFAIPMQRLFRENIQRKDIPRMICMVADQMPSPEHAYWTTFMHQETGFYTGTERIARRFNYPVLFLSVRRIRRGYYEATFHKLAEPPYETLSLNTLTERYVRALEKNILAHPEGWLWSHKRWKHQRTMATEEKTG